MQKSFMVATATLETMLDKDICSSHIARLSKDIGLIVFSQQLVWLQIAIEATYTKDNKWYVS